MSVDFGNIRNEARKSMETKPGSMRDKEVDTNKKTIRRRQMTHQRGPSNTGSLRTPKKSSNSISTERGWSAVKSLPSRKYDIATLMAIGKNGGMNSIVAKFSSHSVENNLVRRDASSGDRVLTEKFTHRTRGASRTSIGNEAEYTPTQESTLRHPRRQPHNAPQGKLAQVNSGFARFLKEHASPKHQRVTAGGRIVPMGSVLPAPEFSLPNKNSGEEDKESVRKPSAAGISSESSSFGAFSNETRPLTQPDIRGEVTNKTGQGQANSSESFGYMQPSSVPDVARANAQHQIPPLIRMSQSPLNMIPVSLLQGHVPPGSNFVGTPQPTPILPNYNPNLSTSSAFNGTGEQGFPSDQSSNQQYLAPQYLPIFTQQPIQGMFSSQVGNISGMFQPVPNLQMPISSNMYQVSNIGGAPHAAPQVQMMSTAQAIPNFPQDTAVNNAFLEVVREYESLSNQLSNLDRYLALHTWDIDQATKRALVEQRKDLVMKIDSARTNKELLESTLNSFKFGVVAGAQNNTGQYFQMAQSQAQPSDGTAGVNPQAGFWNPNIAPHHGSHTCNSEYIANTSAPLNTYSSNTFTPTSPEQAQGLGESQYGPAAIGYEDQHPFEDSARHSNMGGQFWNQQPNYFGKGAQDDGHRSSMAYIPTNPQESDHWSTPKKPAPPEISQVYSRIEEAANGGATVEKLLKDLALVTAKLNEARAGGHGASSIQRAQSAAGSWGVNPQNRLSHDNQEPKKSMPRPERNIPNVHITAPQSVPSQTGTHSPVRGEDRKDGVHTAEKYEPPRDEIEGACDYDYEDEGSSYSDESTNSWATIEVGDKRWLAREKSKGLRPRTSERPSNQEHRGFQDNGFAAREGNIASPGSVKVVKPKRSGESRTVSLRQTTEWIESVNSGGNEHVLDQSPRKDYGSQSQNSGSQANESPEQARSGKKQVNKRNDIFALGPWSRGSGSSQKVDTSTSFQNVNAQAFLPSFDGAGDPRPSNPISADTVAQKNDSGSHEPSKALATEPQKWYMKPQREIPSPIEVRKFFRDIEEEERVMIEKYQMRHPL